MRYLNRSALRLHLKEPARKWAAAAIKEQLRVDFPEELIKDSLYLISDVETGEEEWTLRHDWKKFFVAQLTRWSEDEQRWPHPLTYALFCEWFDAEIYGVVADLERGFIRRRRH